MAYSINVDESFECELHDFLPHDKNITTQELLFAYIKKAQEVSSFKKDLESLSNKLLSF